MKTELLKQFRFISRKKTVHFERRLITFVIFLVVTAFIWLFNTLHKEYTTDIVVPVDVVNVGKNLIPCSSDSQQVLVKVRSSGFGLLHFLYLHQDFRIQLDASSMLREGAMVGNKYRIGESSWYFIERFKRIFGSDVSVIAVLPDSFVVEYAAAQTRMLPVQHRVNYKVPLRFVQVMQPRIVPDSVEVTGPAAILDTMRFCYTESLQAGDIQGDTTVGLKVSLPHNFRVDPSEVKVKFYIDRYTEKNITVRPVLLNIPDSTNILFFPEEVSVRLSVALRVFNTFRADEISVYADFTDRTTGNYSLPLKLGKLPEGVFNPVVYPPQVEFIVKGK